MHSMAFYLSIGQLPSPLLFCPVIILVILDKRTSAYFKPCPSVTLEQNEIKFIK